MELAVTEEQEELRSALRRYFTDKAASAEVRRLMDTPEGYDPGVWAQMAGQLGLQSLAIPEKYGGAGFGFPELAVVMEEMGRRLFPSPYLGSAVLAAQALLGTDDEYVKSEHLPGIADGTTIAAFAFAEKDGAWRGETLETTARADGDAYLLEGEKHYVLDGHVAGLFVVLARTGLGPTLFTVPAGAPGITVTPLPTLDQTRRLSRVAFAGTPAHRAGTEGAALPVLHRTLDLAAVALAAEELGGAQRLLELSVEYAKARHQFGSPIGSFQAIKHKCADLLTLVESSRSASMYAARVADEDPGALPVAAALAQSYCADAYFACAAETIQIHGGIGFTWEHDAHLYFKRAKSSQLLFGTPASHRARLAPHLGL